ncbi:FimB/Mfa2 family fimbrial subunit [Bacteroides propionicifaciens]|uniref:FimB/Mfa2 family fimbrial subunit n=1 Tax=Bacteroides propionicifaciens TaxID=392838 RepID=UPI00037CCD0C|nr:FimB/Mfa2 family fimbrial subunit [Bacteroides propionicifaciens]
MSIINRAYKTSILTLIFIGLNACGLINDDLDSCAQKKSIQFYEKDECTDITYFDKLNDVVLLAFDDQSNIIYEEHFKELNLNNEHAYEFDLPLGVHQYFVWSGVDAHYIQSQVKQSDDLFFALKCKNNILEGEELKPLYSGGNILSQTKSLPTEVQNIQHLSVNLKERTNRMNVVLELDKSDSSIDINNFEVIIKSSNGAMYLNGQLPVAQDLITYFPEVEGGRTSSKSKFYLLELKEEQQNELIIRNKVDGSIIYKADLLHDLLLKNEAIKLNCLNDFQLKFILSEQQATAQTYSVINISVNDWIVYSHDVDL